MTKEELKRRIEKYGMVHLRGHPWTRELRAGELALVFNAIDDAWPDNEPEEVYERELRRQISQRNKEDGRT